MFWCEFCKLFISCTNKWKPAPLKQKLCFRDTPKCDRWRDPTKHKSDHNESEKHNKKWGSLFLYLHRWFKDEAKNSDRNSCNWSGHRSNATCSHQYLFHFTLWVTNWALQPISIVSWVLRNVYNIFHFNQEQLFFTVTHILGKKCRENILDSNSYWKSWRDRVGMVNCLDLHMYHCATVSASNLKS